MSELKQLFELVESAFEAGDYISARKRIRDFHVLHAVFAGQSGPEREELKRWREKQKPIRAHLRKLMAKPAEPTLDEPVPGRVDLIPSTVLDWLAANSGRSLTLGGYGAEHDPEPDPATKADRVFRAMLAQSTIAQKSIVGPDTRGASIAHVSVRSVAAWYEMFAAPIDHGLNVEHLWTTRDLHRAISEAIAVEQRLWLMTQFLPAEDPFRPLIMKMWSRLRSATDSATQFAEHLQSTPAALSWLWDLRYTMESCGAFLVIYDNRALATRGQIFLERDRAKVAKQTLALNDGEEQIAADPNDEADDVETEAG